MYIPHPDVFYLLEDRVIWINNLAKGERPVFTSEGFHSLDWHVLVRRYTSSYTSNRLQ